MMSYGKQDFTQQHSLCLITKPSLQAHAFLSLLHNETLVPVHLHDIRTPLPTMLSTDTMVLFDMVSATKRLSLFWQNALRKQQYAIKVLLLNIDNQDKEKEINAWPYLSAIFYQSDTQAHVHEGIKNVVNSGYYLSPALTSSLRIKNTPSFFNDGNMLTEREKQILHKLRDGATNNDIARTLFISEHTVRTHLYNMFKKIKVKNRTQAVSWANGHLASFGN